MFLICPLDIPRHSSHRLRNKNPFFFLFSYMYYMQMRYRCGRFGFILRLFFHLFYILFIFWLLLRHLILFFFSFGRAPPFFCKTSVRISSSRFHCCISHLLLFCLTIISFPIFRFKNIYTHHHLPKRLFPLNFITILDLDLNHARPTAPIISFIYTSSIWHRCLVPTDKDDEAISLTLTQHFNWHKITHYV